MASSIDHLAIVSKMLMMTLGLINKQTYHDAFLIIVITISNLTYSDDFHTTNNSAILSMLFY